MDKRLPRGVLLLKLNIAMMSCNDITLKAYILINYLTSPLK